MDVFENGRLSKAVMTLAREWAPRVAGREDLAEPMGREDVGQNVTPDERRSNTLATISAFKAIGDAMDLLTDMEVGDALTQGASFEDLGAAWGVGEPAARKRWRHLVREGNRVAVVISRRDRVHHDPDDDRGSYGEVGGTEQYESDRGSWPIGAAVRDAAEYAIVAVDGTVRRIYYIDGWDPAGAKWKFKGSIVDDPELEEAYAAGDLPLRVGDPCPTRRGGAYRPLYY